jgi:hypothetical protein
MGYKMSTRYLATVSLVIMTLLQACSDTTTSISPGDRFRRRLDGIWLSTCTDDRPVIHRLDISRLRGDFLWREFLLDRCDGEIQTVGRTTGKYSLGEGDADVSTLLITDSKYELAYLTDASVAAANEAGVCGIKDFAKNIFKEVTLSEDCKAASPIVFGSPASISGTISEQSQKLEIKPTADLAPSAVPQLWNGTYSRRETCAPSSTQVGCF